MLKPEFAEQLRREIFTLVGAHGEPRTRRGKGLKRGHGTGKGRAFRGNVRLVMHQEVGQHLVDILLRTGAAERILDHHPRAEADRLADGLLRNRAVPSADERIVERVSEIGRRVDEGAVEIENDRRISQTGARHLFILSWLLR
jgi:hypothetical protein